MYFEQMTPCDVSFLYANPYIRCLNDYVEEIPSLEACLEYQAICSGLKASALKADISLSIRRSIADARALTENVRFPLRLVCVRRI